jgi:thiamine pyrophosphokinase
MPFVLIVCNGEPPPVPLLRQRAHEATLRIAADGGLYNMIAASVLPDILVGDLDSTSEPYPPGIKILHKPDQETNDLEKALDVALELGESDVLVLGATGLRLDQTLKNLSVLQRYHGFFRNIVFEDAVNTIRILNKDTELSWPIGTLISLFPISGIVEDIVTEGLRYPLMREQLKNGQRDGSSNVIDQFPARIRYGEGTLMLIVNHEQAGGLWR